MPTPSWAQCRVEVYEEPGFLDDCFRSGLWVKFQSAASESFVNANDISGDYAVMTVTEGATVNGCGWRRDVSGLGLGGSTYPIFRVRLRGRGTSPQYRVEVEYTDAATTSSGWVDGPTDFEARMLQLTAGKTVKYLKLYARSSQPYAQAIIDYDYACILKHPPLVPAEVEELVADLVTTTAVSGLRLTMLNDPLLGVTQRRYTLDENLGTKAYDLSRNRHQSDIVNATWNSGGRYGYCLYFLAASSCRLETGYKVALAAAGALTIAFWVKASAGAPGVVCGFGKTVGADWNRIQFNWSSDKLRLYVKDDAANVLQCTSLKTVADGAWHFIVGVVNPGSDKVELYVDGDLDGGATGTLGAITLDAYDLTWGCVHTAGGYTSYTTCYVDEALVASRALTSAEVKRLYVQEPLSGAAWVGAGAIVMVYLAAASESLVYKLITARVIDRVALGEPDNPLVQLVCEDLGEILLERTFSKEYASATQISTIVDDVLDESPELYQDKDTTNRAIVNRFHQEGVWSLLEKLAETATFASGESGANFWVDPGGALRFKRYGAFACPYGVTDGSGGGTPNILDIQVKESIKGSPRLANDVRVIVFEEETQPSDGDALTESVEGWSSPDPTDGGYPQSDTGDKVAGSASVHFNTTNPGSYYRMRVEFPDLDVAGFDSLKFQLKYSSGLSIDNLEVRIWRGGWLWVTDYYEETGITPQGAAAWHEYTVDLASMSKTGNPGSVIANVQVKAVHSSQVGTGGFLIDNLRFVRDEKVGAASDHTSQAAYGKRTLRVVDKTITDVDYAGYVASNILAHRKNPVVTARVRVPGRAQLGYRPPQTVTVTSLKDDLEARSFQIVRAQHRYTPGSGYVCDLDLAASRLPDGSYEPKVAPAVTDVGLSLAALRRMRYEAGLNSLRSVWV
ncbi:MAG TPA: LamG domain-containing protein [Candidatus Desulfaltia sp.]|nr:LamG domain-containing protein [Candidatus Desulfaltia sp.]